MERPKTPPRIGNADRSGGVLATSILALTIVVLMITLRFITRIWIVKKVGWDDWCIMFAGFGHMVGMGLITKGIGYGFGRPAYYLTDHQFQEFMKYAYGEWLQVSQPVIGVAILFVDINRLTGLSWANRLSRH
ncbi:uncharacterized protein KY384_000346 [Bacidia gigantensis]|uniref:uncharacterized protein n=1 Tax=Bacidia gigantensis TaxID=2732470 RepID=UPI001D0412D6|nr:uncharacterized protein KY384_000346 [Bacidia gigantensis]KAG8526353.1 hypothetical protein KY384_000346 [Bacidia gigantensis]